MPAVCVYCASSELIDDRYKQLATDVGTAIAESGLDLVSGGGSISCMGAVARGARAGGAFTTGVIPEALLELEVHDADADDLIVVPDMRVRKGLMDEKADAFLALPGGIGTLEELIEVWTARSLHLHDKPVVILDPWNDYAALHELVAHLERAGFIRPIAAAQVVWTYTVEDALAAITSGIGVRSAMSPTPAEMLEAEG
jgi:uncharacterized protein (TIGR00730 family)